MPEGHTVHRLAAAFTESFAGQAVRTSSPQGRFPEAAAVDGWVMTCAEAVGKHLFLALAPAADVDPGEAPTRFVHVHLGLYGSWTFQALPGAEGVVLPHAIGAPRVRVGETEDPSSRAVDLIPRPTVRLRVQGRSALADLTGPTACELLDHAGRQRILDRLGPDPLRGDADPERFVHRVLRSRTMIGTQLMNQEVVAGIGNIYRAELLFRAMLDPTVPGRDLSAPLVHEMWEDLSALMAYGARTGRIVTTDPAHRHLHARIIERSRGTRQNSDGDAGVVPREESFYVYHRQTLPCRLCGTEVRSADMAGRTVFWCPRCQRVRSRRASFTREHPAAAWIGS
ncbi:Fpg/Nei family DNA glycosylase [Brachybacterium hainanense]|uniref:DNA-(apurinic or apyrimidinic site) lyase n=1 Tax=Brachybacterium hainanense TaxID=1541174 RepID=A0ABV6RCT3_9MICO